MPHRKENGELGNLLRGKQPILQGSESFLAEGRPLKTRTVCADLGRVGVHKETKAGYRGDSILRVRGGGACQ